MKKTPLTSQPMETGAGLGDEEIEGLIRELAAIRAEIVASPAIPYRRLDQAHANYRISAGNLLHYLALRRRDLRPRQLIDKTLKSRTNNRSYAGGNSCDF